MRYDALIVAVLVAILLSCSGNQIAGGSGTETTNSFAFLENGTPAKSCKVFLIDSRKWLSQADAGSFIVDSTIARNDGSFTFEYNVIGKNKNISIQIDHDISGLFRRNVSLGDIDGVTFVLGKYASIHGTLPGVEEFTPVKVDGTTYSAVTGNDGSFVFEKVPAGMYALFTQHESGFSAVGSVKLPPDSLVTVVLQPSSAETFLITDFECGYKSPIAEASGIELFWYLFSDSADKGYDYELSQWVDNASADVMKTGTSSIHCLIESNTKGSLSLQVDGKLDQECEFPYAGAGMVLYTAGDNGVDLQYADSMRFDVTGKGRMRIIFIVEHPVKKEDIRFADVIDLNEPISPIAVNLNSLKMYEGTPDSMRVSWKQACSKVRMVEFAFYGSDNNTESVFSAEIDNIVFIGNGIQKLLVR